MKTTQLTPQQKISLWFLDDEQKKHFLKDKNIGFQCNSCDGHFVEVLYIENNGDDLGKCICKECIINMLDIFYQRLK